ncbi:hypothetical protein C8R43DRAFT_1132173 [Mycena crocata]|nr:hypothetical protein C8R43DRAFT_1132173 [Mycena crocata]
MRNTTVVDATWNGTSAAVRMLKTEIIIFVQGIYVILVIFALYFLHRRRLAGRHVLSCLIGAMCILGIAETVLQTVSTGLWLNQLSAAAQGNKPKDTLGETSLQDTQYLIRFAESILLITNNALADSLMVYRCYLVWRNSYRVVVALPVLLALAATISGYVSAYQQFYKTPTPDPQLRLFFGLLIGTTISLSVLTVGRIWHISRAVRSRQTKWGRRYNTAIKILLESAVAYLICSCAFVAAQALGGSVTVNMLDGIAPALMNIIPALVIVQVSFRNALESNAEAGVSNPGTAYSISGAGPPSSIYQPLHAVSHKMRFSSTFSATLVLSAVISAAAPVPNTPAMALRRVRMPVRSLDALLPTTHYRRGAPLATIQHFAREDGTNSCIEGVLNAILGSIAGGNSTSNDTEPGASPDASGANTTDTAFVEKCVEEVIDWAISKLISSLFDDKSDNSTDATPPDSSEGAESSDGGDSSDPNASVVPSASVSSDAPAASASAARLSAAPDADAGEDSSSDDEPSEGGDPSSADRGNDSSSDGSGSSPQDSGDGSTAGNDSSPDDTAETPSRRALPMEASIKHMLTQLVAKLAARPPGRL